jgi:hypothetical protein
MMTVVRISFPPYVVCLYMARERLSLSESCYGRQSVGQSVVCAINANRNHNHNTTKMKYSFQSVILLSVLTFSVIICDDTCNCKLRNGTDTKKHLMQRIMPLKGQK